MSRCPEDILARRWDARSVELRGWGQSFGAQLVHNNLRMRSFDATESTLSHSKQMKRGEYEQGRKN